MRADRVSRAIADFQELLDLSGGLERRVVMDGFAGEPAADGVDRLPRDLQDRPPRRLDRDSATRLRENRVEAADRRISVPPPAILATKSRETIEPWKERGIPTNLKILLNVASASTPSESSN